MANYQAHQKQVAEEARESLKSCPILRGNEGLYIPTRKAMPNPPWPKDLEKSVSS